MNNIKLNKQQLKAVKHKKGPLLIIAGAGTGKTTVIIEKIKHIIKNGYANPSEILALTFTEKAAQQMQNRVEMELPMGYFQMWISTFHSFCDQILRDEAFEIGLDPGFRLMSQSESIQFIKNNLFEFGLDYFSPRGNPTKFVSGLLNHFSRLTDEDISPVIYKKWLKRQNKEKDSLEIKRWQELVGAYQKYKELKIKNGLMDFSDLIGETLNLFRTRKNVLNKYRDKFKFIFVDEFQDTNVAQYELLKLLANSKNNPNLIVVGDDSQSIYKFRGAAISNILFFKKDYKNALEIVLTKNYRSTQKILDSSYNLIQFNNPDTLEYQLGIEKNLKSALKEYGYDITFIHTNREENEASEVAKEINLLKEQKKIQWKDVAILVRANTHSDIFIRAFQRYGIPYQFLGPGRLFKQPEILDLIAYLKVLCNPYDDVHFFRLLGVDFFGLSQLDVVKILNFAKNENISLFEACGRQGVLGKIGKKGKLFLLIKTIKKHLKLVKNKTAGQILYLYLEETGILKKILNPDTQNVEIKAKNIGKFFDKLRSYESNHEDSSVFSVVEWIDLSTELGESPLAVEDDWTEVDAVNILTIHSAKGLEFPIVFMVNLVSQRFPTVNRREKIPIPDDLIKEYLPQGDAHIQEERRLFYVGMTRAKKRLYFTASDYYGDGKRKKQISPFVYEALGNNYVFKKQKNDLDQLSIFDYRPSLTKQTKKGFSKSQKVKVNFLSYSQIQTFDICPLHYKLKYIYNLPTPSTSSQSFGNSFHLTMKDFYEEVKRGKKPTLKLLNNLLSKNWISLGYISKLHEERAYQKAQKFLKDYLKTEFDKKNLPVLMEQPFVVRLRNGKKDLKIGGKIDRIDKKGNSLIIVDYKTGERVPSQKLVDKDLQLSIYALAATKLQEKPFGVDIKNLVLKFIFFDPIVVLETRRSKEQLDQAQVKIFEYKEKIENSDFVCSGNMLCKNCEYKILCDG